MSFSSLLISTATLSRPTYTSDGGGGYTTTLSDVYLIMPCRVQPMTVNEQETYGKKGVESAYKLFTESVYSFIEEDVITINSDVYDIQGVRNIDFMGHHTEAMIRKIKPNL